MRPLRKKEIHEVLSRHGLEPNKKFGQNFLADPQLLEAMVEDCDIQPYEIVLEIGTGTGNLTVLLANDAKRVLTIERDQFLEPVLQEILQPVPNVEVRLMDFLEVDLGEVAREHGRLVVVGNLPYYVSTEIMLRLCQQREHIDRAFVTVQKEVAERMVAGPGTPQYGRLSVAIQLDARPHILRKISKFSFLPIPKVDSVFLRVDFDGEARVRPRDRGLFDDVVQAAFAQRRKVLRNTMTELTRLRGIPVETTVGVLEGLGIDTDRRGETLSVEEFVAVSDALGEALGG